MDETIRECGRWAERRQSRAQPSFPLVLPNGVCVPEDRRRDGDRRTTPFNADLLLFKDIRDEPLVRVLSACPVREYSKDEALLVPGQPNHDIYLVLSGRLSVRLATDVSAPALMIERGECVGELSIIDGKPVSAFVAAECASRILVVPDVVFWSQIIALPGVARNLLTILSERMRQDNEMIIENVRRRLELEHIEKELRTARSIQASMLPRGYPLFPECNAFDVYALMDPAKEISGDFFDAFLIGDDKLFFAIGDVSGKGIPAALFMVRVVTLLRMAASRDLPPHEVLARVNHLLCRNNDHGLFVTAFCGVLDAGHGTLAYCNGGHDPPLIGQAGAGFDSLECGGGMMLGVAPDAGYPSGSMAMRPGDIVLCYTDGVTEALNRKQQPFTHARLRECVAGMESAQAEHVVRLLHAEIRAFAQGAPQSDDIAMLALKYRGIRGAGAPQIPNTI